MERHIYGVSELNNLVKAVLESVPEFGNVCVRGEISNYKLYPSGHHYFTLKDAEGALLRRSEPRRGGGPSRGLRAAEGKAVEGGALRRGP